VVLFEMQVMRSHALHLEMPWVPHVPAEPATQSHDSIAFPVKPGWLIDLDQRPKDTKRMVGP
jgi:hypothetical protein